MKEPEYPWPFTSSTARDLIEHIHDASTSGEALTFVTDPLTTLEQVRTEPTVAHDPSELHRIVDEGLAAAAIIHDRLAQQPRYTTWIDRPPAETELEDDGLEPDEPFLASLPRPRLDLVHTAAVAAKRALELLQHPDYRSSWENPDLLREHRLHLRVLIDCLDDVRSLSPRAHTGRR